MIKIVFYAILAINLISPCVEKLLKLFKQLFI